MKSRFLIILLIVVAACTTILAGNKTAKAATGFDLYVAGTQVTDDNKYDVLGDGTVSFDPDGNVLKLGRAY